MYSPTLATRFSRQTRVTRGSGTEPLSEDQMRIAAPSIFAEGKPNVLQTSAKSAIWFRRELCIEGKRGFCVWHRRWCRANAGNVKVGNESFLLCEVIGLHKICKTNHPTNTW